MIHNILWFALKQVLTGLGLGLGFALGNDIISRLFL